MIKHWKKVIFTLGGISVAVFGLSVNPGNRGQLPVPAADIVDSILLPNDVVQYEYVSNKQVGAFEGEDISLRTQNSIHFRMGKGPDGKEIINGRFFPKTPFYQRGNAWFEVRVATTTYKNFVASTGRGTNKVYADTIYSGAGDGQVIGSAPGSDWTTAHDLATGDSANYTGTTATVGAYEDLFSTYLEIERAFIPIDTSSIPDGASITAATLNIYVTATSNGDNDGDDWINVVQTSQASNTTLSTADYDQCGAIDNPTEGATRIDITGISTSAYTTFTLNATGRGWISDTGYSLLGLREGHDATDVSIAINKTNAVTFNTSETTGTANDPYLDVTYSVGGGGGEPAIPPIFFSE